MAVKIRLKRFGKKKQPCYRLVAMDSRNHRDGKDIEILGIYNPQKEPVLFECKKDRIKYWLSVGAQPTETAARLLDIAGVITAPKRNSSNQKVKKKDQKSQKEEA
jgi:small subunit ribosomal protein S16